MLVQFRILFVKLMFFVLFVLAGTYVVDYALVHKHLPEFASWLQVELTFVLGVEITLWEVNLLVLLIFSAVGFSIVLKHDEAFKGTRFWKEQFERVVEGLKGLWSQTGGYWRRLAEGFITMVVGIGFLFMGQLAYEAVKNYVPQPVTGLAEAIGVKPVIRAGGHELISGIEWTLASWLGFWIALWLWTKYRAR